jgi:SPP1 gp7 family putative phage head morphogenesis protein
MKAGLDQYLQDGSDFGVEARVRATNPQLASAMGKEWRASMEVFGNRILDANEKRNPKMIVKQTQKDAFDQAVNDYIRQWTGTRVTQISQTTVRQIRNLIERGEKDGLGTEEIGRDIRKAIPGIASYRAATIARTETHTASNMGAMAAAQATGLNLRKEWLAAEDDRTREDHAEADGQIVGLDEAFTVGGVQMMEPGDPSAPPEQTINCRCGVAFLEGVGEVQTEDREDRRPPERDPVVDVFDSGFGKDVNKLWEGAPQVTRMAASLGVKPSSVKIGRKGFYRPATGEISTPANKMVFTHEYGHFIDYKANGKINGNSMTPISYERGMHLTMMEDAKEAGLRGDVAKRAKILQEFKDKYYESYQEESKRYPGLMYTKTRIKNDNLKALSDIYDAATRGEAYSKMGFFGHGKTYYKRDSAVSGETFANMSVLYGKPEWSEVKKVPKDRRSF